MELKSVIIGCRCEHRSWKKVTEKDRLFLKWKFVNFRKIAKQGRILKRLAHVK